MYRNIPEWVADSMIQIETADSDNVLQRMESKIDFVVEMLASIMEKMQSAVSQAETHQAATNRRLNELQREETSVMLDDTQIEADVTALTAAVTGTVVPTLDDLKAKVDSLSAGNVTQADLNDMSSKLEAAQAALAAAVSRDDPASPPAPTGSTTQAPTDPAPGATPSA